jgi:Protein of unknown function (DUF1501)
VSDRHNQDWGGVARIGRPPGEAALGKPLVAQPEPLAVVHQHLQSGPLAVAEDENGASERVFLKGLLAEPRQAIDAATEVGRLDGVERSGVPALYDARTQQAFDLLGLAAARRAFRLDLEPPGVRDRYGRNAFGQGVLLARRLVEPGVPLVRVNWTRVKGALNNGHWDTHSKNTEGLKQLMPIMDQAHSALLEDLGQRGMLDDVLVVWTGEFGRTPKINAAAGRHHWGQVFSVALAGGGVRGGQAYGASDRIGAYPKDGRVRPEDLTATVLHCLGIPPDSEIRDSQGRPLPASRGEVMRQVL